MSGASTVPAGTQNTEGPPPPRVVLDAEPFVLFALCGMDKPGDGGFIVSRFINGRMRYWAKENEQNAAAQINGWLNSTLSAPTVDTITAAQSVQASVAAATPLADTVVGGSP